MRECEEMPKIVQGCRDSRLDSRVTRDWQAAKVGTRMEHVRQLKSHASCCTTGQKSQAGQAVSLWLELATQPIREVKSPDHPIWEKTDFSHSFLTLPYIDPYTHEMERAFREIFEKETLGKNKIDSSTIFT